MSRKSQIQKTLKEMKSRLKSLPELEEAVQAIDPVIKETEDDEDYRRIKLPYVSAKPIRGSEWKA